MIKKIKCSGCSACKSVCPTNAIKIKVNTLTGFKLANIDKNKCITCNKCESVCPHINCNNTNNEETQDKYVIKASEDILKVSSSGGAFSILAEYYTSIGYKIVGVQWDEDWHAEYAIAETAEEWHKFRGSKYMQPDTKDIFVRIKRKLNKGDKILFVGVPCHVSGLYNFLGKKYTNLVTIDLFCGALSSPLVWDKWYEYQDIDKNNIASINMRAKKKQGNKVHLISIVEKDGQTHNIPYATSMAMSIVSKKNFSLPICHDCKYRSMNRVGDYTIADHWGSKKVCPELHDDTQSMVSTFLCNSNEAKRVIEELKKDNSIKIQPIDSVAPPKNFEKYNIQNVFKNLHLYGIKKPQKDKVKRLFDIAVCGGTFNSNFGATLTYYALYRYLELLGYKTIILPPSAENFKGGMVKGNVFDKYCNIAPNYFKTNLLEFNSLANTFILGSDQLWNHENSLGKMGPKMYLDYIKDNKNKIAYSVSYGGNGSTEKTAINDVKNYKRVKRLIKEFDYISTREEEGIKITEDIFGRNDCAHVIDPVFLLNNDEYDKLIEDSNIELPNNEYGCYYQIMPSQKLINFTKTINKHFGVENILIGCGQIPNVKKYKAKFPKEDFVNPILAQDWLKYIKNAKYVITSSFHCCCFCVLFNIPFLCVRGEETLSDIRIKWLLESIGEEYRYMYNKNIDMQKAIKVLNIKPNTTKVLNDFVNYSKKWLNDVLLKTKTQKSKKAIIKKNQKVGVCIIAKWEEQYLNEWIEHYKKIGFDNVLFYDNSEEGNNAQYEILKKYIDEGFVIYNDFRGKVGVNVQGNAYTHCRDNYKDIFDWIAFFDADEFLELVNHKTIHEFLQSNEKFYYYDGIVFNWLNYSDNNLVYNDGRPLQERFIIPINTNKNYSIVKTMVNMNKKLKDYSTCHVPFARRLNVCNANGIYSTLFDKSKIISKKDYNIAYLKHYKDKTIEENCKKIKRGDCNGRTSCDVNVLSSRISGFLKDFFYNNTITEEKINVYINAFPEYKDFIIEIIEKIKKVKK